MRRAGLALILVLSAILAAEIFRPAGETVPRHVAVVAAIAPPAPPARAGDETPDWVASILARPLFNTDRRPVAARASAGGPAAAELPRLAGVMVTPGGRLAIFAAGAGGKPFTIGEGGRIGVFTVTRIDDTSATVIGPDGTRRIEPSFAAGADAPPSQPSAGIAPLLPLAPGAEPSGNSVSVLDLIRNPPNIPIPASPRK